LTYVRAGGPPVLTVHGDADPVVPYTHGVRLKQTLDKAGVANELITVPGGRHGGFNRERTPTAYAAIQQFLTRQGLMPASTSAR